MKDFFDRLRLRTNAYSIAGIVLLLAAGVLLLLRPDIAMTVICVLLGLYLLGTGIIMVVRYIKFNAAYPTVGSLIIGIILIVIGIIIACNPLGMITFLGTIISIYLIIFGIVSLILALKTSVVRDARWRAKIIGAIAALVIGVILLIHPVDTASFVLRIVGLVIIYTGINAIIYRIQIKDDVYRYRQEFKNGAARFNDRMDRYADKDIYGNDIIDGTARDVTDDKK